VPFFPVTTTADEELKKKMEARQQVAMDRQVQLSKTTSMFDDEDENVLERVFQSLAGNATVTICMEPPIKDNLYRNFKMMPKVMGEKVCVLGGGGGGGYFT
jgi:hypothetical protein